MRDKGEMDRESNRHRLAWEPDPMPPSSGVVTALRGGNIGLARGAGKIQASRESRRTNQSAVSMDTGRTSAIVKQLHKPG